MRITDKHVFFWKDKIGNWGYSPITIKKGGRTIEFRTSEHYFMYLKAITFNDEETAEKIIESKTPREAKDLGRLVKNYNDSIWDKERFNAMKTAVLAKFTQNKPYYDYLLEDRFDNKLFVEASPYDKIWGVGIGENDPRIDDEKNWVGQNLMGRVVTEIRNELKK